jgi:hypothetical protein
MTSLLGLEHHQENIQIVCICLGQGPRRFKIGRRVYILKTDWHARLEGLAESGGAHGLDPRGRD